MNNRKFGIFFESQSRFNDEKFPYDTVNGPLVAEDCISGGNLYNFGGEMCNESEYKNCVSLRLGDGFGYSNPLNSRNENDYYFGYKSRVNYVNGFEIKDKYFYVSKGDNSFVVEGKEDCRSMRVAVWSLENGQDDLKWYPMMRRSDGTFIARAPYSNLKHSGKIIFHIYTDNNVKLSSMVMDYAA